MDKQTEYNLYGIDCDIDGNPYTVYLVAKAETDLPQQALQVARNEFPNANYVNVGRVQFASRVDAIV